MAATAVGCLWLLWRQGGASALGVGLVAVAALVLLLVWTGWRQRSGEPNGIAALVAIAVLAMSAALVVPTRDTAVARVPLGASAWSEAAVQRELAAGHPVFIYFTADWCLTCKVNEASSIDRDETRDAFGKAGVKVLVGDWTNGDPEITRFLESRGRAAVPLYLWYQPGKAQPEELPQVLTPGMLVERARSFGTRPSTSSVRSSG
jgi:thiol:disulfide interchange protein